MGQGQVTVALDHLHAAARQGDWLCLKNLHLMTYWLPTLEKELKSLCPHENFRLWFTAEAHPRFSAILAQSCLKVTYEVLCWICLYVCACVCVLWKTHNIYSEHTEEQSCVTSIKTVGRHYSIRCTMLSVCLPYPFFAIKDTPLALLLVYYRHKFVFSKFIALYLLHVTESEFSLHIVK